MATNFEAINTQKVRFADFELDLSSGELDPRWPPTTAAKVSLPVVGRFASKLPVRWAALQMISTWPNT